MFDKPLKKRQTNHSIIHHEYKGKENLVIVFSDTYGQSAMQPLKNITDYVFVQGQFNWHVYTNWQELKDIASSYLHVTATGMSMGGTGALLSAHHLPINKVVSFVPQINLKTSNWARWYTDELAELDIVCNPVPNVDYNLHTGTWFHDLSQVSLFHGQGHRTWHDCHDHQICAYLKDVNLLYHTILH
jgi:hypothetical protein